MPSLTMPIVLAALSLMTRSNYVSCSTGDVAPAESYRRDGNRKIADERVPAACRAVGISR